MRNRMVSGKMPSLNPGQDADRSYCVLIDRIDVVHVVLHLRHDTAEIGDEAPKHAGFIHPS